MNIDHFGPISHNIVPYILVSYFSVNLDLYCTSRMFHQDNIPYPIVDLFYYYEWQCYSTSFYVLATDAQRVTYDLRSSSLTIFYDFLVVNYLEPRYFLLLLRISLCT